MKNPKSVVIRKYPENRRIIIFIHGFTGDGYGTFGLMPAFIAGDFDLTDWDICLLTYPTSLAPDITGVWSADPDLTQLSCFLHDKIIENFADYEKIALVAHSMGGLMAQRAVLDLDEPGRIAHLIMVGTPSAGLKKARLWKIIYKRQVRDMASNSKFMKKLIKDREKKFVDPGFELLVVAGLNDQFVPHDSSLSPFACELSRRVVGDHLSIVKPDQFDSEIVQLVTGRLKNKSLDDIAHQTQAGASEPDDPAENIVKRAQMLEMTNNPSKAIDLLHENKHLNFYVVGALAGRYKRIWLADPENDSKADAGRMALETYIEGYTGAVKQQKFKPAVYNAVNVAFMQLALNKNKVDSTKIAKEALPLLASLDPEDYYHYHGTSGELQLHLGNYEKAIEDYRRADNRDMEPMRRASMFQQAIWTARLMREEKVEQQLQELLARKMH